MKGQIRDHPFIINEDWSGQRLESVEGRDELWLQELLRRRPEILPVAELEPVFYPMIPIGREVLTERGAIDNLYISERGYLTLVETKLWRNPEARREVVGQVMEYSSSLSKWDYNKLDSIAKQYTKKYENKEQSLAQWVAQCGGEIAEEISAFEDTVSKNLRLGRFLVLIVGDRIQRSLIETLHYTNRYPHLATNVVLLELQGYCLEAQHDWPLLFVPRIVAETEIVERSIVQVTVAGVPGAEITVKQEKAGDEIRRGSRPPDLNEEAFWDLLAKQASSQYETVLSLINDFKQEEGIEIVPKARSISIRIYLPNADRLATLFFVTIAGDLCVWPKQLSYAGAEISEAYRSQMQEVLRMPKNAIDFSRPIAEVDLGKFKDVVNWAISQIRMNSSV